MKIFPDAWEAQKNGKKTDLQIKSKLQFWSKSVTFLEILPVDPNVWALSMLIDGAHKSRF